MTSTRLALKEEGKRNGVLEFEHGKVQFDGCLRIAGLEVFIQYLGDQLTAALHQLFLLFLVWRCRQLLYIFTFLESSRSLEKVSMMVNVACVVAGLFRWWQACTSLFR